MQKNKRKHRETKSIDSALRLCQVMMMDFTKPIDSRDTALPIMGVMFTNGLRLCKLRERVMKVKPINPESVQAKAEAITAIDEALISVLDMAEKVSLAIKEKNTQ